MEDLKAVDIDERILIEESNVIWCSGPSIVPWLGNHFCSNGIPFDIEESGQKVIIIKGAGKWSALKQISTLFHSEVDPASIAAVGLTYRLSETFLFFGNSDQMDMIVHECVGDEMQAVKFALFPQQVQVSDPIVIGEKDPHRSNSALSNMVR
jgi:hypothetical protein